MKGTAVGTVVSTVDSKVAREVAREVAVKPQRRNGSVTRRPIATLLIHRRRKDSSRSFDRIALI